MTQVNITGSSFLNSFINRFNIFNAVIILAVLNSFNTFGQQNYFQQRVEYDISVKLDDKAHILNCQLELIYKNNSPDTLSFIWFHLWPNAYSNRNTALVKQSVENGSTSLFFAEDEERGGIDNLNFRSGE